MTKVRNLVMLISLCLSEFRVYKYHLHATLLDTQDFTNPDVLKTRRTLTGLSLWFCLHKCFWRTLRYDNSRRRKWIPRKRGKFIKSQFKILTCVVLRGWLNMLKRISRGIWRAEFEQGKYVLRTKKEKSKEYCKADHNNVYCFFIIIFRLAVPAFFRFTDVTEFIIGITISYRWRMSQ